MELNHDFHPAHKLAYKKKLKKADKGLACAACLEEISGPLAYYYSCRKCNLFLHELCAQRPLILTNPLHPQHPEELRLFKEDTNKGRTRFCRVCTKAMKGFIYDCSLCNDFYIDFKCAFPKLEKRIQNFEHLHDHPLTFQAKPAKFNCDECHRDDEEDQSYSCSTCDFYIHKMCAYTKLAKEYDGHNTHPLSLVRGVPEDLLIYRGLDCHVCHKTISPEDWVAHCAPCRHGVDYLDDSFFKHLLKDDESSVVRWPPRDIASELIQPFLVEKYGIVIKVQPKIRHFNHKQHDLILFDELCVNNDRFFKEEDEEILCEACVQPITAPYYGCEERNYYIHLACANLPTQIKHLSHPDHELVLGRRLGLHTAFTCAYCSWLCNGFGYRCGECNFSLDLTCGALPGFIMHETHEHPLVQMKGGCEKQCYACGNPLVGDDIPIFKCLFCDIYLGYSCAMRTPRIRHRWDRQHPFPLRFPPHGDHPDHLMCDMCEELIHPKYWLYSCFKCDVSFHVGCSPRYKYPNVKFGAKVQIHSHRHILKFLQKATLKIVCDKCGNRFDSVVFECETCYDCICFNCVRDDLS